MKSESFKTKLLLLDITDEVVVDIVTNKNEPFGLVEMLQLHIDNDIPKEKMLSFITKLSQLQYNGYLTKGLARGGRMWTVTKKWKFHKFYEFKGWKPISWIVGILISLWGLYLKFIEIPKLKTQLTTTSQPASPIQLTKQDSINIYHSVTHILNVGDTSHNIDTSHKSYKKIDTIK